MFINQRVISNELRTLRSLNLRSALSKDEYQYYLSLEKGLEGERKLDQRLEELPEEVLILRDLTLEIGHSIFQVDTLLIFENQLYLLEVKNLEGDYYLDGQLFKNIYGKEIRNPLLQLNRCASLLRQFLQSVGFNIKVNARLVFINQEFTLYQAPLNTEMIFPTQINRFIKSLKSESHQLSQMHHKLANQLLTKRLLTNRHETRFSYDFDQLKKGVICFDCYSYMGKFSPNKLKCQHCKKVSSNIEAVLANIEEFRFLFPEKKLRINNIYQWCGSGKLVSINTVRKALNKNYILKRLGPASYYTEYEEAAKSM
ncbi:nuclease-related domain-containing protein [Amphibacillus xylanus]|uniref:NERD domain-containing protein n=1 Tax=Amphibacillus xylanus (strain ATCC 51415 / DSM 6626 / JCM 7361 / LMG 17667 / NBRC 15112 / Ep01) TaxID=698758 RepID=K0IXM2_AMPXN|nr:nuclease-related domain-containing protein [Amphibacillus xylanus]BAM47119.1 hypothetical protein AXY_09870 [Amphibacillus xylanus NBRC 15112]